MSSDPDQTQAPIAAGSAREVLGVFLKLGLTSFGGPIAHLGYFRDELITRRGWLDDRAYADLVALCQFLPGPASSQVGFALGLMRAGWLGALAAFTAFTLPSAVLLFGFAMTAAQISGPVGSGALDGLKIVAVAIVAQAVWGMARTLCPDAPRATIAVGAVAVLAVLSGPVGMLAAIIGGALAGLAIGRTPDPAPDTALAGPVSPRIGWGALAVFAGLFALLPLLAGSSPVIALIDAFYRAGALVFGGGHVVLPLLEAETVQRGWISQEGFLAGYGAAQAVPGPLFTFAGYLGALITPAPSPLFGAGLALAAIFLPGFLLLVAVLPHWDRLRRMARAQAAMAGSNAAVVGILGAALYAPIFTTAIRDSLDFALALACFLLLTAWKAPPWAVVGFAALGGVALALTG